MQPRDHGAPTPNWWGSTVPSTLVVISANTYVGMLFSFPSDGRIFGVSAYTYFEDDNYIMYIATRDDFVPRYARLMAVQSSPDIKWKNVWLHPTFRIVAGAQYYVAVQMNAHYLRTPGHIPTGSPITNNGITAYGGFQTTSAVPWAANPTINTNANGIDVLFKAD